MAFTLVLGEGSAAKLAEETTRGRLATFCADLMRGSGLAGCIALLPSDSNERAAVMAFLMSFKRGIGQRTSAVVVGKRVSISDFVVSDAAAVDEIVILQGCEQPKPAIESVLAFRTAYPQSALEFRVWLDPGADGSLQEKTRAWQHAAFPLLGVELAPFSRTGAAEGCISISYEERTEVVHCEWLRSIVMIDSLETIIPCPAHSAADGISLASNENIMGQLRERAGLLASHPVCRGCHRRVRFSLPDWMSADDEPRDGEASPDAGVGYWPRLHSRLDNLPAPERDAMISAFLERIRN